jgi:hypothetical protein
MRTTVFSILFGPRKLGGGDFIRWYEIQGEGPIMLFLKHWRCNEDDDRLLRVALACVQYQSGLDTPILEDVHTPLPYLESRWIPALWLFLSHIDAKLVLDSTYIAPHQRELNEYLMRRIIDTGLFLPPDLHIINCCRLYLDVVTLSNILMACGGQMDTLAYQHERPESSTSNYHRSVQRRPNNWVAWDRAMSIWFHDDSRLRTPLRLWLCTGDRLCQTWSAYYDNLEDTVYCQTVDGYAHFTREVPGYVLSELADWQPTEHFHPVRLQTLMDPYFEICGDLQATYYSIPVPSPTTFDQFVQTLPDWEQDILENVVFHLLPFQLATLFESSALNETNPLQIQFVSDGSQIRDQMSFGWAMSTPDGTRLATCAGPGFGLWPRDVTPSRRLWSPFCSLLCISSTTICAIYGHLGSSVYYG